MNEREYRLSITDRFDEDGQRNVFISVSVPREDSPEAVRPLLRAASDIVFGCDTELYVPDIEDPDTSMPRAICRHLDRDPGTYNDGSDE